MTTTAAKKAKVANDRIAAAAPDLLHACKVALAYVSGAHATELESGIAEVIRAAIAKAEGAAA